MRIRPAVRRATIALAATLAVAGLSAAPATAGTMHPAAAKRAISCSTASSGKAGPFYPGPSASYVYDRKFAKSHAVPDLGDHTPQGIAAWHNWDGKGHTLLLVTAYRNGAHAYVHGIDASSGAHINTAEIAATHAGGIAVSGKWIFISGAGQSIRKYRTADMRLAMNHRRGHLYIKSVGTPRKVHGASFMSAYNGYLFSGLFNDSGRDRMYAYKIASNGTLTTLSGGYEVPTKTQGVAVTGNRFLFSTSYGRTNRGNIYVVKRGYKSLDSASLSCFRSPSMNEGIAIDGSRAYVVYESGSYEYSGARNRIKNLHRAALSSLVNMV